MTIILNSPAVKFLTTMLADSGWTKSASAAASIRKVFFASKIIVMLPETVDDKVETKHTLDISDGSFQVCKDCISWFLQEGRCPSGPGMLNLIETFELFKE